MTSCWCNNCKPIGPQPSGMYIPRPGEIQHILADGIDARFGHATDERSTTSTTQT